MPEGDLETVIVRLAGLELTISARRLPSTAGTSIGVSSSPLQEGAAVFFDPHSISQELENRAIQASTAGALAELPLPFLSGYISRLRGADPNWTPQARIGRAFRAGVVARRQLDGLVQEGQSLGVPFRNSVYVVLRDRDHSISFWTSSYTVYANAVLERGRDRFSDESISHAFPTQTEAEVYCAGARTRWPAERRA